MRSDSLLCCLAALLLCGSTAWAQEPVRSLSDLPARIQAGERIEVTDREGKVVRGRFESVAASSLRITVARGRTQDIAGTSIKQIGKERPDSDWNGILLGLGAGLGMGALATQSTCPNDPECAAIAGVIFIPTFAAGGAAIGALIDHSIKKYDPIYLQQATSDRPRLRLSPLVSKRTKGVLLSLSF